MQARYFKIVLWVSALIVVWQLGRSDVVLNALFLFAAAGVVPGTNIILQPNDVFWALGILLGVAVVLIFATNLRRGLLALFRRRPTETDAFTPMERAFEPEPLVGAAAITAAVTPLKMKKVRAAKVAKPKVVVVIKPVRRPSKTMLMLRLFYGALGLRIAEANSNLKKHYPRFAGAVGKSWHDVKFGVRSAVLAVGRAIAQVARQIFRALAATWKQSEKLALAMGRTLRRKFIKLAIYIGRQAVRLWNWAEPHLRLFDYWLGVQYHSYLASAKHNETVKSIAHVKSEITKVITTARTEIRAAVARAVEK
jgi:hypothetical protein